jgi:hypothetical protein
VLTDALRNAFAERDAAALDGGEQLRRVRADCDSRLQLVRAECDDRVQAARAECNVQLQAARAERSELSLACLAIDRELASNGVARGLQGVEQLAGARIDLGAAHAVGMSVLRAELEACDAPRTSQGVQTLLGPAAPTAEQGVQTGLAASGPATGGEAPPHGLVAVQLRAATGQDKGGVISDFAAVGARDSCTVVSSSLPIAAELTPSVTVPAAKPGEWLAAAGASAELGMMPPVVASASAGAPPSASSAASPRTSALGLLATPSPATASGGLPSAMLAPRTPPAGSGAALGASALDVSAASPELQLPPGLGPEGACRRRAMVEILRGTGAQPLQGKENERSRRRRVARQLLALTPRAVVLAATWAFKLRNRARHRASVLMRCTLLLNPMARRYLEALRRRAHSRKLVLKMLESPPRTMAYDVICDASGAFSFCSTRGVVSSEHPASGLEGSSASVPAYSADGRIVAPLWPPLEGPGSAFVLTPEVNGAWCYVNTEDGSTSWFPPADSTVEPPTCMAGRFNSRHVFSCEPPPLDPRIRLGTLHSGTPWSLLRNDAAGDALLLCRTTGLLRGAPWISLCDVNGCVFFANVQTRQTRWFPPNRWWTDMISRPGHEPWTRDRNAPPMLGDSVADTLLVRRHPLMRDFLGIATARTMVEGGSPYLGEFGKPQYARDLLDTGETYPWVDETGALLAEAPVHMYTCPGGRLSSGDMCPGVACCDELGDIPRCFSCRRRRERCGLPRCLGCSRRREHCSPAG